MGFLCIDIGGTNTLVGVGDTEFEKVEKISSEDFVKDVEHHISEIVSNEDFNIDEVAVAVAGPVDRRKGVFKPPNIDLEEVQIREPLEKYGDLSIINDCTSAVLGEYYYGDHDCENLIYITISSGIGAGVILNGELVEGSDGNLGEIGHMQIKENGRRCGCGGKGHWEAYCSGNSLPEMGEELTGRLFDNAKHIFEQYESGNNEAIEIIEEMKDYNLQGLTNIVNIFNPGKILLGGAVALNHEKIILEGLEESLSKKSVNETPSIELCGLGERSVLHGLRAVCNKKDVGLD